MITAVEEEKLRHPAVAPERGDTPLYPAGPVDAPADFASPTLSYRRRARRAVVTLVIFLAAYAGLILWFGVLGIDLMVRAFNTGHFALTSLVLAAITLSLCGVLIRALFYIASENRPTGVELSAEEQPRFHEFIRRVADDVGAPRPQRIVATGDVNAAVMYDGALSGIVTSNQRHTLMIGLGLLNVLSVLELKALIAHELGHLSQRSMRSGRWVHVCAQIARPLSAGNDALDKVTRQVARFALNPIGVFVLFCLLGLKAGLWSVRSISTTGFRLLLSAHRALSREMELQADLIAVSVTGSDAPVHVLYKLPAASDAMRRVMTFAQRELALGRRVPDIFGLQKLAIERLRIILRSPDYGATPRLPAEPALHRLFRPTTMWPSGAFATHPGHSEREANCKERYLSVTDDCTSAWTLFCNAEDLRCMVTEKLVWREFSTPVSGEEAIQRFVRTFERPAFAPLYRGAYLREFVTLGVGKAHELCDPRSDDELAPYDADKLYPADYGADVALLGVLNQELMLLRLFEATAGEQRATAIVHRGATITRTQASQAIREVLAERSAAAERVLKFDRACRAWHRAAAIRVGTGWLEHLRGLLEILFYAEHCDRRLSDLHAYFLESMTYHQREGRIQGSVLPSVVRAAEQLHQVFADIDAQAPFVSLDGALAQRLGVKDWALKAPHPTLNPPETSNLAGWINAESQFFRNYHDQLHALRMAALDQLLIAEQYVAAAFRDSRTLDPAPAPSRVPTEFATCPWGSERPRPWVRAPRSNGWFRLERAARAAMAACVILVLSLAGFGSFTTPTSVADPRRMDRNEAFNRGTQIMQRFSSSAGHSQAAPYFRRAAETGDPRAQYDLGLMLFNGDGLPQDRVQAVKYFQLAADQHLLAARVSLGLAYLKGDGVSMDYASAAHWLLPAAQDGSPVAQRVYGVMLQRGLGMPVDAAQADSWFEKAANQDDQPARQLLAVAYLQGSGVEKDERRAVELFRVGGRAADADAEYALGHCYLWGLGVERNYKEALDWLKLADQQHQTGAAADLGVIYLNGWGVEKDTEQALRLLNAAAAHNDAAAEFVLGTLYYAGREVPKDPRLAFDWTYKSASGGHAAAQFNLALFYSRGIGVAADHTQENLWLARSAAQHYDPAVQLVAKRKATTTKSPAQPPTSAGQPGIPMTDMAMSGS